MINPQPLPIVSVDGLDKGLADLISLLTTLTSKTAEIYDEVKSLGVVVGNIEEDLNSVVEGEGAIAVKNNILHPALNVIVEV